MWNMGPPKGWVIGLCLRPVGVGGVGRRVRSYDNKGTRTKDSSPDKKANRL